MSKINSCITEIKENHLEFAVENTPHRFLKMDYTHELNYISPSNINDYLLLLRFGDIYISFDVPVLTKTRPVIKPENNILLYLTARRHWESVWKIKKNGGDPITWDKKINHAFWRGCNTGRPNSSNQRLQLVKRFIKNKEINVGFNVLNKKIEMFEESDPKSFVKPSANIFNMLKYKYLISIEGNDVATNLKWIMYSNSLVLMPMPKIESWFLESELKPWTHFVPLKDNSEDLEEKIEWCRQNDSLCKHIVNNANQYVKQFINKTNETKLSKTILETYIKKVKFQLEKK